MRDNKKQIEEMAQVIIKAGESYYKMPVDIECANREAIALYTAGYRKQNDTAKEILKPLYNVIMKHSECCVNLSEDIKFLMGEYGVNLEDEE